ncbi:MAG: TlpA family protein disulfide reductase [Flavobacteriales bacterium]
MRFFLSTAIIIAISIIAVSFSGYQGQNAPDIAVLSKSGGTIRLSSLRGKYVLVDFWASFCGPCRKENSNLISVYRKYKNATFKEGKGFEVFQVSLDKNKAVWLSAVKKDGLIFAYQGIDSLSYASPSAKKYGVTGLPSNFLIDPKGKIIKKDLRGNQLSSFLEGLIQP